MPIYRLLAQSKSAVGLLRPVENCVLETLACFTPHPALECLSVPAELYFLGLEE